MRRRFAQIDVFGERPYLGNPVAVIVDGEGLSDDEMQALARWTNLSETAFLLPARAAGADYRVRIFTLAAELAFAGHPTLGSCHAWLSGRITHPRPDPTEIVQECGIGLVRLRFGNAGMLEFAAPPLVRSGPVDEAHLAAVCGALGIARQDVVEAEWVDNGPGWIALLLSDASAVLSFEPAFAKPKGLAMLDVGLVGLYPAGSANAIEVRAFFSDENGFLREDPVTGSLNASLGQWLLSTGRLVAPYTASQGTRLGRRGRALISQDGEGTVWVAGTTHTAVSGWIDL